VAKALWREQSLNVISDHTAAKMNTEFEKICMPRRNNQRADWQNTGFIEMEESIWIVVIYSISDLLPTVYNFKKIGFTLHRQFGYCMVSAIPWQKIGFLI